MKVDKGCGVFDDGVNIWDINRVIGIILGIGISVVWLWIMFFFVIIFIKIIVIIVFVCSLV